MNNYYKRLSEKELKEIFEDMQADYWIDQQSCSMV